MDVNVTCVFVISKYVSVLFRLIYFQLDVIKKIHFYNLTGNLLIFSDSLFFNCIENIGFDFNR